MLLLKNDHKHFGLHGEDTFSFFEILLILVSHLHIVKNHYVIIAKIISKIKKLCYNCYIVYNLGVIIMLKIKINDQNITMYINLNDNEVTISFSDSSLNFLNSFVNVVTRKNKIVITLGNKKICEIRDGKIIYKSKITSTEIRVLSSIYNFLDVKDASSNYFASVKEKVKEQFGVELEPEVKMIGEF